MRLGDQGRGCCLGIETPSGDLNNDLIGARNTATASTCTLIGCVECCHTVVECHWASTKA